MIVTCCACGEQRGSTVYDGMPPCPKCGGASVLARPCVEGPPGTLGVAGRHLALKMPFRDIYNAEHDMLDGPCACGAWHHGPEDFRYKTICVCRSSPEAGHSDHCPRHPSYIFETAS